MFDITIDAGEFIRTWNHVRAAIRVGVRKAVSQGVTEGAEEARTRHVFKNRTGDLERSIVGRLTATRTSVGASDGSNSRVGQWKSINIEGGVDGAQFGEIKASMPYASFVENGTRPHLIEPKNGRWLAWEQPQGDWHFARRVNHPGTQPHPFMSLAYLKCERVMIREIELGVANAQKILDS